MSAPAFSVRKADWDSDREDLMAIRHEVFIVEQKVPVDLEMDGLDPECSHVLAVDESGKFIGTARLMPEGRIGRVAVTKPWRRRGVGAALMLLLIEIARKRGQGEGILCLHAQTWTIPFYESLGFTTEGDEFYEAGIAHRSMVLRRRQSA